MQLTERAKTAATARKQLSQRDLELAKVIGEFYDDPLGFVLFALPWGVKGTRLEKQTGPDDWQADLLNDLGAMVRKGMNVAEALPVLMAVASGHGIGKTALISWIILWFIATRQHPQIIVTAGKKEQLQGKTWRELAKWNKMSMCGHWFHWTATKLEHVLYPETWFANAIPWSKNAPENFAGTHEEHVLVVFDEASAVDDVIWEVTDGAMTTPGAMWIAFGNPTRTTGRFAQCFGKFKHRWWTRHIDSRSAKMANKAYLQQMVDDYGEDSDFVRVRVRGLFPRAGSLQLISIEDVAQAQRMEPKGYEKFGRVMGVDIARHGDDQSVICMRQQRRMWPLIRMRIPDLMKLASRIAEVIDEFSPDTVFVDATGMGWGVVDRLHQLGYKNVIGVQTGEASAEPERFRNLRAELWIAMQQYIKNGGQLPKDNELESELTEPEYGFDDQQRYVIESKKEMKKRDLASPDGADAIALTMMAPVAPTRKKQDTWRNRLRKRTARGSSMAA